MLPKQTSNTRLTATELPAKDNGFGVNLEKVTDTEGKPLSYVVNKTMMRIDLPKKTQKRGNFQI
jgi:hypothetical protein